MLNNLSIFYNKKILIYGLGKSGLSALKFLKKNNKITTYDDKKKVKAFKDGLKILNYLVKNLLFK